MADKSAFRRVVFATKTKSFEIPDTVSGIDVETLKARARNRLGEDFYGRVAFIRYPSGRGGSFTL